MLEQALQGVLRFVEKEGFKGYDPYDTLLSPLPFHWAGKWGQVLAIQAQKRNPVNVRPLLGIRKDFNPKAMGLFLHAYSLLYSDSKDPKYLEKADFFLEWLMENVSREYSGACWGYNFPWASPLKYLGTNVPSAVVTGIVIRGVHAFYLATGSEKAMELIKSSCRFILDDLPRMDDDTGSCISYTPVVKDVCYNASLLAAELIARNFSIHAGEDNKRLCIDSVEFVVQRQKLNGRWDYSEDISSGSQRIQTDFHQGYILESILSISKLIDYRPKHWTEALEKGLEYYRRNQFFDDGRSLWRVPKVWPVDIHNQSQGIITFVRLKDINPGYASFASTIAEWTCANMRNSDGSFQYRKFKSFSHKIPYIRWSQAWMLLALCALVTDKRLD